MNLDPIISRYFLPKTKCRDGNRGEFEFTDSPPKDWGELEGGCFYYNPLLTQCHYVKPLYSLPKDWGGLGWGWPTQILSTLSVSLPILGEEFEKGRICEIPKTSITR